MSQTGFDDVSASLVASVQDTFSKVSVKAVGIQLGLMTGISVGQKRLAAYPDSLRSLLSLHFHSSDQGRRKCMLQR